MLHKSLFYDLFEQNDCAQFKSFIISMSHVLSLFSQIGIVHSDLKPENILVLIDPQTGEMGFKIIDLGSSFPYSKTS